MKQQISKNIFRHEFTKHAAGVGKDIVAALGGINQRLDSRVNGLGPLQRRKSRQRIPNQFGLAEDNVAVCGLIYNFQIW